MKKWKPVRKILFCLILLCGIRASAAEISPDAAEYAPFAAVSDIKVNKKEFKPGDTLEYELKITDIDIGSHLEDDVEPGVTCVIWQGEQGQEIRRYFLWPYSFGSRDVGGSVCVQMKIKDSITISKGMQPGKWTVSKIGFVDGWEGIEYAYDLSACIVHGTPSADARYTYVDFSPFDIYISGSTTDNEPPTIDKKSVWLKKNKIKRKKSTLFRVKVEDESQIKYVSCRWKYTPNKKKSKDNYDHDYIMTYNKKKKVYECRIDSGDIKGGCKKLISITVCDIFDNKTWYVAKKSDQARGVEKKYLCDFSKMKLYAK